MRNPIRSYALVDVRKMILAAVHLNAQERGVYMSILFSLWDEGEGFLRWPEDEKPISRLSRCSIRTVRNSMEVLLDEYLGPLVVDDGVLKERRPVADVHRLDEDAMPPFLRKQWNSIRPSVSPVVMERDGAVCAWCGSKENLTIDHITPISGGGTNDLSNLQVLCQSCNSRKGSK